MLTAIETVDVSLGLIDAPAELPAASDNDRALADLTAMMGGVK